MKLKFQANKPNRLRRYFWDVTINFESKAGLDLWCSSFDGKWKTTDECKKHKFYSYGTNSRESVRTIKAFKKYIKKHSYLPPGTILRLNNKYVGYDVTYTIGEK